jgi:hypothetical protein
MRSCFLNFSLGFLENGQDKITGYFSALHEEVLGSEAEAQNFLGGFVGLEIMVGDLVKDQGKEGAALALHFQGGEHFLEQRQDQG